MKIKKMNEQKFFEAQRKKTSIDAQQISKQEVTPHEIEEMQRELHMSGRAMKTGESLEDYSLERRESWETKREQDFAERYSQLSSEMQASFISAQQEATLAIQEHIQGKRTLENLMPEEAKVLGKLVATYTEFKKNNPDKPFAFQLGQTVDQKTLDNLTRKIAFSGLDAVKSQEKANEIREQIGIEKVPLKREISSEEVKENPNTAPESHIDEEKKYFDIKYWPRLQELMRDFYRTLSKEEQIEYKKTIGPHMAELAYIPFGKRDNWPEKSVSGSLMPSREECLNSAKLVEKYLEEKGQL